MPCISVASSLYTLDQRNLSIITISNANQYIIPINCANFRRLYMSNGSRVVADKHTWNERFNHHLNSTYYTQGG